MSYKPFQSYWCESHQHDLCKGVTSKKNPCGCKHHATIGKAFFYVIKVNTADHFQLWLGGKLIGGMTEDELVKLHKSIEDSAPGIFKGVASVWEV